MSPEDFVSLVHSLSVPSLTLNKRDLAMVYLLADVFSSYSSLKWERLSAAYPEAPSLSVYMSDGWSADVSSWCQKLIWATRSSATREVAMGIPSATRDS